MALSDNGGGIKDGLGAYFAVDCQLIVGWELSRSQYLLGVVPNSDKDTWIMIQDAYISEICKKTPMHVNVQEISNMLWEEYMLVARSVSTSFTPGYYEWHVW